MVTQATTETQYDEYEESDRFEKISRRTDWVAPSRRGVAVWRARHRASATRRPARRSSNQVGGQHQRRIRKFR